MSPLDRPSGQHLHYLRHKNGGGKLFDTSEADKASFVDRNSEIREDSSIWWSKIIDSKIIGSVISNAILRHSVAIHTDVQSGFISDSLLCCEYIGQNARIENCDILGKSRVSDSTCQNVKFQNLTVTGNTVLRDWPEDVYPIDPVTGESLPIDFAHGYIARGVWERPPRVFKISKTITLTESTKGFAFVHCREFPLDYWLRIGHRYGAKCGWTADEVKAVRKIIHMLKEQTLPKHQITKDRDRDPR